MTTSIDSKAELLARARRHHHLKVWDVDRDAYINALKSRPFDEREYQKDVEPVIDATGLYDLDNNTTWLTINKYNALVLNTANLFIADVDFGDRRFNDHAGVWDVDEVKKNLSDLSLLDAQQCWSGDFKFSEESWRIYRTHSGCRVVCISRPMPWDQTHWESTRLMQFLGADPHYIALCRQQRCYRARLTPKPWRDRDDGLAHACRLVYAEDDVAPDLAEQIRLHDDLTLWDDEEYGQNYLA